MTVEKLEKIIRSKHASLVPHLVNIQSDGLGGVVLGIPDFVVGLDVGLEKLWDVDDDGDDDDGDDVLEEPLATSLRRVDRLAVVDRVVNGYVPFCKKTNNIWC